MDTKTLERHPTEQATKHRSHAGMAFTAGIATGLAAGLFLRSEKGKELTEEARRQAIKLQKQLIRKIDEVKDLTKERYEEIVDDIVENYARVKELAETELRDLRHYLLAQWDDVRTQWNAQRHRDEDQDE